MTTINQARTKLRQVVEQLATTWTDYPLIIEYDNLDEVNLESQTNPYLKVNMIFMDGIQADIALKPIHRILGTIIIEAVDRVGAGNAKMDKLLTHFYEPLQMTDVHLPLRMYAARPGSRNPSKGWIATAALIPFWYDRFPT